MAKRAGRHGLTTLLLVLACAGGVCPAPAAARVHGPPLDTRLEFRRTFKRVFYSDRSALLARVAADGANGVNAAWERGKGPGLFIEEQRYGDQAIIAGALRRDRRLWRRGLRELEWGFAQQGPRGDFPATRYPFHSTSFFVEAVAHVELVLRGARSAGISLPPRLVARLDSLLPRLHAAARWMARTRVWKAGLAFDAPCTHRRYLVAAALGLTAALTGDRKLRRRAREALVLGLDAQRPDGVQPELDGYDSSYQARGVVYAEHYLAWLPRDPRAARLRAAIARGLRWERTRILPSGQVSTAGNTRTREGLSDHNGPKRVVYPMVARALLWWGLFKHRTSDVRLARHVAEWGSRHPGQVGI